MIIPTVIAVIAEPKMIAMAIPPGPTWLSIFMQVFSPAELVMQRFPAAQVATRVVVATQLAVTPLVTKHSEVWTVFVVEQRSVPVVVTAVPVVEELELVFVVEEEVVEEVVEDAVVAVEEADVESEVLESVVVDAAALEGAAVLEEAAADDSVFSVVFAVVFVVVFAVVLSVAVAESEFVFDESALLLRSTRSASSRTCARYSCANHTAPTDASAFEHPPAM